MRERQGPGHRVEGPGDVMKMFKQLAAFGAMAATLVLAGCRQDMQDQPKFFPQRGTDFYADGRSVRPQVENTVARGQLRENGYFYTGLVNGKEADGLPFPVTSELLERGQERYNVYCTPCDLVPLHINDPPPPRRPQRTARGTPESRSAKTSDRQPRHTGKTCP